MSSNPDSNFLNLFIVIAVALVGVTFAVFLVANFLAGETQRVWVLQNAPYDEQVLDNIRPIGRVALHSEESAQPVQVAKAQPVAEVKSGPQVYNLACLACHGAGVGGAPVTGDSAVWKVRIAQGAKVLNEHAIKGYTGDAGFMPPKGGRVDLSDQEILAAVDYIVEQSR
jgi:cytochrome c5